MNCFGEDRKAFAIGLSHDDTGHVDLTADTYETLMKLLYEKIMTYEHLLPQPHTFHTDDAEIVIIAFGSTARS